MGPETKRTSDPLTNITPLVKVWADQPLPLPAGVSNLAVGVTSGAGPDVVWLAAIAALLFCVSVLRARRGRPAVAS